MDIKKIDKPLQGIILCVVMLGMVTLAWRLAKAYEAPQYQVIDSCEQEWPYVHIGADGHLDKSTAKLAWYNKDMFNSELVLYDPVYDYASRLSDESRERYAQEVDGPEYSFIRRMFWPPFFLFLIIFGFLGFIITSVVHDLLMMFLVEKSGTFDDSAYFLSKTHFVGVSRIQKIYKRDLEQFIRSKEPALRRKYNDATVAFVVSMLRQMASSKEGTISYNFKIIDQTKKDQRQYLEGLRTYWQGKVDVIAQAAVYIQNINNALTHRYHGIVLDVPAYENDSNINVEMDQAIDKIFTQILGQEILRFDANAKSSVLWRLAPPKNTLFAEVSLQNNIGFYTFNEMKLPKIDLLVHLYFYDDKGTQVTLYKGYPAVKCDYGAKMEDFKASNLYANLIDNTLKNLPEAYKSAAAKK